jgi:hypothetical protein
MDRKAKNEKGAAERVSLGGEDKGSSRRSVVVVARSGYVPALGETSLAASKTARGKRGAKRPPLNPQQDSKSK